MSEGFDFDAIKKDSVTNKFYKETADLLKKHEELTVQINNIEVLSRFNTRALENLKKIDGERKKIHNEIREKAKSFKLNDADIENLLMMIRDNLFEYGLDAATTMGPNYDKREIANLDADEMAIIFYSGMGNGDTEDYEIIWSDNCEKARESLERLIKDYPELCKEYLCVRYPIFKTKSKPINFILT